MTRAAHVLIGLLCCPGFAALAGETSIPASAYRQGLPEVLADTSVEAGPVFDKAKFATAYARAKRPAILVFWNRELTDSLRQTVVTTTATGTASRTTVTAEEVEPGVYEGVVDKARAKVVRETRIAVPESNRRPAPVVRVDAPVRSGFLETLIASGVLLVDRNLVMRSMATAGKTDAQLDSQLIEMASLSRYARLLMEVTSVPDPGSALGWSVRVTVKRASDGVLMLDYYGEGAEAFDASPRKFVADPRGGFKAEVPRLKHVGEWLARQTLARLADTLAH